MFGFNLRSLAVAAAAGALITTAAIAVPEGVQNPAVKARMEAMDRIAANMKTLGGMAKGVIAFNADAANAALDAIAAEAAKVPALFEAEETDPKSAAKAEIWFMFDDFTAKAHALEKVASTTRVTDKASLGQAMGKVGQACKACHMDYKAQ